MEKLIRLLRIINLVQSKPGINAKELALICETSERTIYRDLKILDLVNVPIVNEGKGKGYKFIGYFKQYPLNWNEDEYNSFHLLPGLLEKQYQTPSFQSAYEKVMATHMAEQIERKKIISDFSKVIQYDTSIGELKEHHTLSQITEAVLSNKSIETIYHTQSRNVTTKRKIDPYFLLPRKNRLYVIGYCHEKKAIRTFRLNRFLEVNILNELFTRNHVDLENYLQYTWGVFRGNKLIHFKVKFSNKVARFIKEEDFNVEPIMTDLPDGNLLFEVTLNNDLEFLRWVLQYGPDAEILEPAEYRKQLKQTLMEWLGKYDKGEVQNE